MERSSTERANGLANTEMRTSSAGQRPSLEGVKGSALELENIVHRKFRGHQTGIDDLQGGRHLQANGFLGNHSQQTAGGGTVAAAEHENKQGSSKTKVPLSRRLVYLLYRLTTSLSRRLKELSMSSVIMKLGLI